MERLYKTIQNYHHERDLLLKCTGMTRVVRLLDYGETHVNTNDLYSAVFYLNIRTFAKSAGKPG